MGGIASQLGAVRARIAEACRRTGRDPAGVELVAVSKTFPAAAVAEAAQCGQDLFGESRQQEAEDKRRQLPPSLRWHFIGPLQRNKARKVVGSYELIHSVDSLRLAVHLDRIAAEQGLVQRVLLEVNAAGEASKCGFSPDELPPVLDELAALQSLRIEGLMMIPPAVDEAEESRVWFAALRDLRDRLAAGSGLDLPHLSMGMSGDFDVAVEEGATLVRVGSLIFGGRPPLAAASPGSPS